MLVANLANKKWCQKSEKLLKSRQMGTHLRELSEGYSMNTWQGLNGFQNFLCSWALDKSNLSIGRVNLPNAEATFIQRTFVAKIFENDLNPVMLVFIGYLSLSNSQMSTHVPGFQPFFRVFGIILYWPRDKWVMWCIMGKSIQNDAKHLKMIEI